MRQSLTTATAPGRAERSDPFLFLLPCFIWGTTWLAIKFQLGTVAPEVSVVWRFALASLLLLGWCALRGIGLRFGARDHGRLALLGLLLFGVNYVLVYRSEQYLTSGLVSVLFAFLVFWNLLGARLFFGTPTRGGPRGLGASKRRPRPQAELESGGAGNRIGTRRSWDRP